MSKCSYIEHSSLPRRVFVELSIFPGYYKLLDDNTFVLGLEVFKKYFHLEIVKKKKRKSVYY